MLEGKKTNGRTKEIRTKERQRRENERGGAGGGKTGGVDLTRLSNTSYSMTPGFHGNQESRMRRKEAALAQGQRDKLEAGETLLAGESNNDVPPADPSCIFCLLSVRLQ